MQKGHYRELVLNENLPEKAIIFLAFFTIHIFLCQNICSWLLGTTFDENKDKPPYLYQWVWEGQYEFERRAKYTVTQPR